MIATKSSTPPPEAPPPEAPPIAVLPGPPLDCDTPAVRRWTVVLWLLVAVWLMLLAVPVLADGVQRIDDLVHDWAVAAEVDLLTSGAKLLADIGGTAASVVVVAVIALVLAWQRRWPGLEVWLASAALATSLNVVIKNLYERARPPLGLVEEQSYSFASGHSLTAAALGITLVLVFVPAGPHRRIWLTVALGYAFLMAASRVYLRAHWFSDTMAGITVGAACAVTVAFAASWWHARTTA